MGDFADCYRLSQYPESEDFLTLREELDRVHFKLEDLTNKFRAAKVKEKFYIMGNHEKRFENYLVREGSTAALEKVGFVSSEIKRFITETPGTKFSKLMQLEEQDWTVVPYNKKLVLGKGVFIHEIGSTSDSQMKNLLGDLNNHNLYVGHGHRITAVGRTTLTGVGEGSGTRREAMMFGWLGSPKACTYKSSVQVEANWPLGFGIGFEYPNGSWETHAIQINRETYTCKFMGKEYK
jgi:hypothetical protein